MTLDELKERLDRVDFKFGVNPIPSAHNHVNWYAWRKPLGAKDCAHNHKPPSLCIYPSAIEHLGTTWESVTIELRGASERANAQDDDPWFRLQCYSLKPEEAWRNLGNIESKLVMAWNAINE